jgi:hypothetical protein
MMNETTTPTNADRMTPAATPWTKISFLFIAECQSVLVRPFFSCRPHGIELANEVAEDGGTVAGHLDHRRREAGAGRLLIQRHFSSHTVPNGDFWEEPRSECLNKSLI